MMSQIRNQMRLEAMRASSANQSIRTGIVAGYDPSHYAVKVRIQPEDTLTGWLPLGTMWVGSGWGMYSPPTIGEIVEVHFQQGSSDAGFVTQRFFSANVQPLAVPSGEFWLVHSSGSFVKLHNDGSIEMNAVNDLNITAPHVKITGELRVTGDITDNINTTNEKISAMRTIYNTHTHPAPGGTTNIPNQQM